MHNTGQRMDFNNVKAAAIKNYGKRLIREAVEIEKIKPLTEKKGSTSVTGGRAYYKIC